MKVRVLAFASAQDAVGTSELEVSLADGARVAELRRTLDERYPDLRTLWDRLAVAVDGELASDQTPLQEGNEVALLPPVSGGRTDAPVVELVDAPIALDPLVEALSHPGAGAVLLFLGNVRERHAGRSVEKILYSAYRPMALKRLRLIVEELESETDGLRVGIVHRLGEIPVGGTSVAIAASSPHRAAAYRASREALERLKREVPIWKREFYVDGRVAWREEERLAADTSPVKTDSVEGS